MRLVRFKPGCRTHSWGATATTMLCVAGVLRVRFPGGRLLVFGPGHSCSIAPHERCCECWSETGATVVVVDEAACAAA